MILQYASDEENDVSKEEENLTITDKDVKLETPEVSLDNVRNDNLFAFDVKIFFNLGNIYKTF